MMFKISDRKRIHDPSSFGPDGHSLMFADLYTSKAAIEFYSNSGYNSGSHPVSFLRQDTGHPTQFDPAPNGPAIGVSLMTKLANMLYCC